MRDRRYDLQEMAKKITDYTKIIYIANPDNPMGTYVTKSDFDAFYNHVPDRVLIILDEAPSKRFIGMLRLRLFKRALAHEHMPAHKHTHTRAHTHERARARAHVCTHTHKRICRRNI